MRGSGSFQFTTVKTPRPRSARFAEMTESLVCKRNARQSADVLGQTNKSVKPQTAQAAALRSVIHKSEIAVCRGHQVRKRHPRRWKICGVLHVERVRRRGGPVQHKTSSGHAQ